MSGTIFQDSHISMQTWFRVMWHICLQKNGISALGIQRSLGLSSYQTAWLCLHKLRKAMIRQGRERLSGKVEVDEAYIGGVREGKRGRGADGKQIVFFAVENKDITVDNKKRLSIGRIRLLCIPDVTAESLLAAIEETVEPGSHILTDGLKSYATLKQKGYAHTVLVDSKQMTNTPFGESTHVADDSKLPKAHLVVSLLKRWILGTFQGSVGKDHLQDYLNEFTFRFNRRASHSRGMLFWRLVQMAVTYEPTTKNELFVSRHPI